MKSPAYCKDQPIPLPVRAWTEKEVKSIPIIESGEKMVPMSLAPDRILVRPQYYIQGLSGALPEGYVRLSVYNRLIQAAKSLPAGFRFVIFDSWRPLRVQQSLFEAMQTRIRAAAPGLSEETVRERASVYVAPPAKDPGKAAPHSTGGAVDLSIADENGLLVNMGTEFDDATEKSSTAYFERLLANGRQLSENDREALFNRRILYHLLAEVGLVNYADEWWHYEYGDQNWAWHTGAPHAVYGITRAPLPWRPDLG